MEINIGDILIVEDLEGKEYEDQVTKVSKYSIEDNSLYMIESNDFYLEFMNDFKRLKIDVMCDASIDSLNSVSKYKLKELWNLNLEKGSMTKIYASYWKK